MEENNILLCISNASLQNNYFIMDVIIIIINIKLQLDQMVQVSCASRAFISLVLVQTFSKKDAFEF